MRRFFALTLRPFRSLFGWLVLVIVFAVHFTIHALASDLVANKFREFAVTHEWLESATDAVYWMILHPLSGVIVAACLIVALSAIVAAVHIRNDPSAPHTRATKNSHPSLTFLPLEKKSVPELDALSCVLLPVRNIGGGDFASFAANIIAHLSYSPIAMKVPHPLEIHRGMWVGRDSYDIFLAAGETLYLVLAAETRDRCIAPSIPAVRQPDSGRGRALRNLHQAIGSVAPMPIPGYQLFDGGWRVTITIRANDFSTKANLQFTVEHQRVTTYNVP